MKTLEISYNPYKMITTMLIDGIDVCKDNHYDKFKEFIKNEIPLQTWIEPISYLDWNGLVNEVSDPEINDEVKVVFSGRVIDFEDLKRSIADQNEERSERTRVKYHFQHKKVLDDKVLSQNIEEVVKELKSDRFRALVNQRTTEGLTKKYNDLDENYTIAKESEFYIVFAGTYSSGKSTLLNTLMRHDILPTSSRTCTSKNCRIRHDGSLGRKVTLACFDEDNKIVGEKQVFENDIDCASAFLEICPIQNGNTEDKHPEVCMMELGVDLSHLYPNSVSEDKFTIVLIDTPGMDSAQSSEDGTNKHAEIALDAISMESKPMIVLCVDANYYDNKSIGEFMREIIAQSKEEGIGFSDRFLFLMNKSDAIVYKQNESPEEAKSAFARYLTDDTKWNIKGDEEELQQLAESASHFVPRVFMTAARIAFAIQQKAYEFTDEELDADKEKCDLLDKYEDFEKKIFVRRKRTDFYLSRYCDIPNYRKDEIEAEFEAAIEDDNQVRATQLQCGVVSVESAVKDYIERYAYPIKVRGLLDTFEDILEDVNSFTNGVLADLKQAETELGEKESERREVSGRKKGVEEKIAALKKATEKVDVQREALDGIKFDSNALRKATAEFRADIEEDGEITLIRQNSRVMTGQKTHSEVINEINSRIAKIRLLFARTLSKTNKKLEEIKKVYDEQLLGIFGFLKVVVAELEKSDVFKQGEYEFTDSVLWKMNFANINADSFASNMKKKVVDKSTTTKQVRNQKKTDWSSSWNPIKKIGSRFMEDYETVTVDIDGYYETTEMRKSIDAYLLNLQRESTEMENSFKRVMEDSKHSVRDLIDRLLAELTKFLEDIKSQEEQIKAISGSMEKLDEAIEKNKMTLEWLGTLKKKIEGE